MAIPDEKYQNSPTGGKRSPTEGGGALCPPVAPRLNKTAHCGHPSLKKDIILLESVQRRFTKRIPRLVTMTYYSRLKKLNLESLELRRLRADLTLVYTILFGVIHTKSDRLFSLRNQPQLRGHNYTLNKPRCCNQTRQRFFQHKSYQFME